MLVGGLFGISARIRQPISPSVVSAGNLALRLRRLWTSSSKSRSTHISFLNGRGPAVGGTRAKCLVKISDAVAQIRLSGDGAKRETGILSSGCSLQNMIQRDAGEAFS